MTTNLPRAARRREAACYPRQKVLLVYAALLSVMLSGGCASFQQVDALTGIASLRVCASGVQVIPHPSMMVRTPADQIVKLAEGDMVSLGDGYHVAVQLKYLGAVAGQLRFRQETVHRPPGELPKREVAYLAVLPYGDELPAPLLNK